jgi:hypothetical protein
LITVPACAACNRHFSRQDEQFASLLSIFVGIETEKAKKLHQKNIRTLSRNKKWRQIIRSRPRPVWGQNGNLITGTAQGVHWPSAEHNAMITRFIKALYYHRFKQAHPLHVPVDASLSQPFTGELFELWRNLPGENIGSDGEFRYRYGYLKEDPESCIWMLIFYDRHFVTANTSLRFLIATK